jgi:ATP-dependent Clp protease ATP-binding subunit ClpC
MRLLEDVLAEEILSGRVSGGDTAMVDIDEEGKVKVISGERRELIAPVIE